MDGQSPLAAVTSRRQREVADVHHLPLRDVMECDVRAGGRGGHLDHGRGIEPLENRVVEPRRRAARPRRVRVTALDRQDREPIAEIEVALDDGA